MPRAARVKTARQSIYSRDLGSVRVYDITYSAGGKKIWESGFPSLKAAQEQLDQKRVAARLGTLSPRRRTTLREFVDSEWSERQKARVAQDKLRTSTLAQYQADLRLHILPTLGHLRLDQISLGTLQRFHDDLCSKGQSSWSVKRIVNTLSGVMELARKTSYVTSNPVRDIDCVSAKAQREAHIPGLEQVYALAEAAGDATSTALILTAAMTGARQSELFAVTWADLDLTESRETIRIDKQFYRGELVDRPKTPTGRRVVPLPPQLAKILRALYLLQQTESHPNPHGLVFPGKRGGYRLAQNWSAGPWRKAREKTGLLNLDFHDLRRFYVSVIRDQGLPTAVTQQLVGHADERTHDGYTHVLPGWEDATRAALASAFSPPSASSPIRS